jgi:hypothetical protein
MPHRSGVRTVTGRLCRAAQAVPGFLRVVHRLAIEPELGRGAEPLAEQDGGLGGDAVRGHVYFPSQGASREAERAHEILAEDVAGNLMAGAHLRLAFTDAVDALQRVAHHTFGPPPPWPWSTRDPATPDSPAARTAA